MVLTATYGDAGATVPVAGIAVPVSVQVDAYGNLAVPGGSATVAIPAGTVANTVVKSASGRLCRVLVTQSGTGSAVQLFDNSTTNTGTVIGIVPATAAVGSVFVFDTPAVNGITAGGSSTGPAVTVSYN
jgi:hypothetical protein